MRFSGVDTLRLCGIVLAGFCSDAGAQEPVGIVARCGASKGTAYFFADSVFNKDGADWVEDGMSTGKIILTNVDREWDIKFSDAKGGNGYRQDGASVYLVGDQNGKLNVLAAHANYIDVYTFNLFDKEVVWTSHKLGPTPPKVAIYRAECE